MNHGQKRNINGHDYRARIEYTPQAMKNTLLCVPKSGRAMGFDENPLQKLSATFSKCDIPEGAEQLGRVKTSGKVCHL